jgi:elongation of very long chain fatty acids protein 6
LYPTTTMNTLYPNIPPYYNARNLPFHQLFQHIPVLEPFYTDFEKNFNPLAVFEWVNAHPMFPIVVCIGYIIFCFGGQHIMKSRERFNLRYPLAYWNLFLSVFSFMGMLRTVPHLAYDVTHISFKDTICFPANQSYGSGACGFWALLFIFSKFPELFDTFFIVLRKRPLIFLHWYHHVTVLLFCWQSLVSESPAGLYFIAMNYTVHAIMYGYYFLMALRIKPPIPAWTITVAQISQMFVGTFICIASYYFMKQDPTCDVKPVNVIPGALMYASYLALFVHFAAKRYIFKSKDSSKDE